MQWCLARKLSASDHCILLPRPLVSFFSFLFFFLLFVILLLRYYIQCKYCIQVWINWTELNWTEWWYRPFPSSKNSHFQKEAKCETFLVIMSFIYIRRKKLFIPMVSHLVETWKNLTCDQTFFFFFFFKSAHGVRDIYRDDRDTAWSQAMGNSEMASKMRKKKNNNNKPLKSWMMLHFHSSFAVEQLLIWRLKK